MRLKNLFSDNSATLDAEFLLFLFLRRRTADAIVGDLEARQDDHQELRQTSSEPLVLGLRHKSVGPYLLGSDE